MGRRVLITGVAGYWGAQLARRLERSGEFEYIAGIDVRPPGADLERTEFIRADIRNPLIAKLVPQTGVDTVVHSDILLAPEPGKAPRQLHDINVIGSLQLLAACEKAPTVRSLVVRGSAAIYGAESNAPAFFSEAMARRFPLRTRFQRDIGELENYFETYSRRYPDVTVTILRTQPSLGPHLDSPLTRLLRQPVVPVQLGFNPLLQFVHADDAVGAMHAAVRRPLPGPVNVAGEGSISLSRLLRLAGKIAVPVPSPLFASALRATRRLGFPQLPPEVVPWLRYGLTLDCARLIDEIGYHPRSTLETVRDFVEKLRGRRLVPGLGGTAAPSRGARSKATVAGGT
jgi:UDP-glucose 4-epimerase